VPKIDIARIAVRTSSTYPAAFQSVCAGREKAAIGNLAGLTQFGVNLTRLKPGAASALRHWHDNEDEFVYVLEGEATLIEDSVETSLRPGDAAGFKAGVPNGHHLINKTERDVLYLEVGTRAATECYHYPDLDMVGVKDEQGVRFAQLSGEPVE
jgi:uncharacterized cupin superfamily protein